MLTEININQFLDLKFKYELHDYHSEGSRCIYQDLIKNGLNIREIIFEISRDSQYLNINKYQNIDNLKFDHMTHYINCVKYGFRKNVIEWKLQNFKDELVNDGYLSSLEEMDDDEIKSFLNKKPIVIKDNEIIIDGFHRCFSMIGRILRGESYINFLGDISIFYKLKNQISFKENIPNIGYRPKDNKSRYKLVKNNIKKSNFYLLEVGSNFGYFSLKLSMNFPNSKIFSVEGSFGTGNEWIHNKSDEKIVNSKGIQVHSRLKEIHHIFNNSIICTLMTEDKLDKICQKKTRFDYQLNLSVFHWIAYERYGNNGNPDCLYKLLAKQISIANITFIELPDLNQENSLSPIYRNHRNMSELLQYLKDKFLPDMQFELLGRHNWYGSRELFKISLDRVITRRANLSEIAEILLPVHIY